MGHGGTSDAEVGIRGPWGKVTEQLEPIPRLLPGRGEKMVMLRAEVEVERAAAPLEEERLLHPLRPASPSPLGPCCPSSSTPSSWPLATKSLQPKASTGQIRPPELTSPGLRLTLATATQAKTGAEASWFTETSPHGRTGAFLYTETSPYAENSPHTETFPHAGSSRPAMQLDSSSTRDISSAPSSSSSKPSSRASIQMVRKVAPVLVLLILLLATVLITCGSHMVRRRREAQLATEGQRDGKVYLSALTTGEEDAPSQDPNGDAGPVPPIYMSEEDLDFSKFVSV